MTVAKMAGVASATTMISMCLLPGLAPAADSTAMQTLPRVLVTGTRDEVVSPALTGGDVDVVTHEEIEENHYTSLMEAIKRIPGVQISGPGYKAYEYSTTFGEEVSINGDSGVIILVDGRRLDNDASSYGGARSKSRVPLDLVTNIANIERIEVIKGTGAAAFGAEATGGVINIITRTGQDRQETTLDLAKGSWGKSNFAVTQSGPITDKSFRYFASATYQDSHDTQYKDAYLNRTVTFADTRYRQKGASFRLDKDFSENQSLGLYWSGTDNKAHYPITAPDYATLHLLYENNLPSGSGASTKPGYRNWFLYDAWLGSFTESGSDDVDLKYTFHRSNGMDSFVRAYKNFRVYNTRDFAGIFGIQYGNLTQALIDAAVQAAGTERREEVNGGEVQVGERFGHHALLTGWDYRDSTLDTVNTKAQTHTLVDRHSLTGFLQDKIDLTSRWAFTPGARYDTFSTISRTAATGVITTRGNSSKTTFTAYTSYKFDSIGDLYASWAEIFRPESNYDYDSETTEKLMDEKGNSWTVGLRKNLSGNTVLGVNYALTDMSNAIARYSVYDPLAVNTASATGFGNFVTRSVNATQKKKALNLSASQKLSDEWALTVSYAYVYENFAAKNYSAINSADTTNINALINKERPANIYQGDLQYAAGKWSVTGTAQVFSGANTQFFTSTHFTVLGLIANYSLLQNTRLYLNLDNLTNTAYENRNNATYGPGAYPQPGRSFLVGVQQKW